MRTEHASGRACVVLSKTLRRGAAAIDLTEGVPAALTLLVGFSRAREERGADAGALRCGRRDFR